MCLYRHNGEKLGACQEVSKRSGLVVSHSWGTATKIEVMVWEHLDCEAVVMSERQKKGRTGR